MAKIKGGKNMEILKVENLNKTYGKGENQVKAVDNISFSVQKGEFVAIIGAGASRSASRAPSGRMPPPTTRSATSGC